MMNNSPLLQCNDVRKAFPKPDGAELLVLEGMNLELREGQIVGLLGRSGSGKSTLLRLIAGLSEPSAGHLRYMGQPISGPAPGIAMVFQSFALFPVADRVRERGARPRGAANAESGHTQAVAAGDRPHRSGRFRIRLSARIVGRHAPACGLRPGVGGSSEYSPHGRAVFRAGCADRGDAAHRFSGFVGRGADAHQGRHFGHPQHRGGGAHVRSRLGVRQQSGADLE